MDKVIDKFKKIYQKAYNNEYVRVFFIIFILGFVFFGTTALNNGLTMGFNGDYTLQTLAFFRDGYTKIWSFIKTGEFPLYDYSNFLGTSYLGTASFYTITSPFYIPLLLFPKEYLFQGIYLLLLVKYAVGGVLFYFLLKKFFHYKDRTCLVGAIVYAFSGWNLFYLWFHFADSMAIFPLLIIGLEYSLQKKKEWIVTLSLVLIAFSNYFFFVTFAIFGVIYFIFRWIKIYGLTKKNGYSFFERWNVAIKTALYFVVGGLISGVILIPNLVIVQQSGRVDGNLLTSFLLFFKNSEVIDGETVLTELKSFSEIFSKENLEGLYAFMFKWPDRYFNNMEVPSKQTFLYIISNFLFMNTNCWNTTVFNNVDLDNNIGGLFISTPLILLLVPSIIRTIKSKNKWDIFTLIVCIILPLIPFTTYLLHGFTALYGRWQLCLILITLIYVLKTFDDLELVNGWMLSAGIIVNVLLAGYCVYYSYKIGKLDFEYRIIVIILQFVIMFTVYHLSFVYHTKKWYKDLATGLIVAELFVSTVITINMHGVNNYNTLYGGADFLNEEQQLIDDLKEKDGSFYRIYNNAATRNYTNLPSALSYNGLSTFNSIYNKNNQQFIDRSDITYSGGWSMGYHAKRPYFDQFVGVKYYIVDKNYINNDSSYYNEIYKGGSALIEKQENYRVNVPFGYTKIDANNEGLNDAYTKLNVDYENFDVYQNDNPIELGIAYTNYSLETSFSNGNDPTFFETMYSTSAIIDKENEERFGEKYQEEVKDKLINFNKRSWNNPYYSIDSYDLLKTISIRNDLSKINQDNDDTNNDFTVRDSFVVSSHTDLVNKIENEYGMYGTMMHGRWGEEKRYGDQIIITIPEKSSRRIAEFASEENPANIVLKFRMGPQCLISLYGENDELLTQDCHGYHSYGIDTSNYERKVERSFYVTKEVKKIVIEFINDAIIGLYSDQTMFNLNELEVSYRYYDEYMYDWKHALDNQLENIKSTNNSFSFDTNYESPKLVCLNVPYDSGWTLNMDGEEVDIILMNGGFIGFIAPSGAHSYYLNYETEYLKEGFIVTLGGLGLGVITFVGYNFHYCLNVSKGVIKSTRFYKKKEEDEIHLKDVKEDNNYNKTSINTSINVIIGALAGIVSVLIALLFNKDNMVINFVGMILGYIAGSVVSYFVSYLFRLTDLDKTSIIRYVKLMLVGLLIVLGIYLLLTVLNVYSLFKIIVSIFLTMPVLYLLHKKILN